MLIVKNAPVQIKAHLILSGVECLEALVQEFVVYPGFCSTTTGICKGGDEPKKTVAGLVKLSGVSTRPCAERCPDQRSIAIGRWET